MKIMHFLKSFWLCICCCAGMFAGNVPHLQWQLRENKKQKNHKCKRTVFVFLCKSISCSHTTKRCELASSCEKPPVDKMPNSCQHEFDHLTSLCSHQIRIKFCAHETPVAASVKESLLNPCRHVVSFVTKVMGLWQRILPFQYFEPEMVLLQL